MPHSAVEPEGIRTKLAAAPPLGNLQAPAARWITWRSVLLGSLAVTAFSAIGPYNDEVLLNTRFTGTYLPVSLVLTMLVLSVGVNGVLYRLRPRWALASGELAVIFSMVLLAGAPLALMRTLVPLPVVPLYFSNTEDALWRVLRSLDLPTWLFPVSDLANGRHSSIVLDFYGRVEPGTPIPYSAWIVPLLGWGVFFAGLFAVLLAGATLLRPQWAVNERLAFPLAQLGSALVQPPRPGYALNDLFRNRLFWISAGVVVLVHTLNGLNIYFPKVVPEIPLHYDIGSIMANEPWSYFSQAIKKNHVYFMLVGMCYFMQTRTSFSLWAIYLAVNVINVSQQALYGDIPSGGSDQHFGACVAFFLATVWVGRQYWARVLRGLFHRRGTDPQQGLNRVAMLVLVVGLAVMMGWLLLLGVQFWVAVLIVAVLLLVHLVIARVVAETGVPMVRGLASFHQISSNLPVTTLTSRDMFFAGAMMTNGVALSGISPLGLGMHGLQVSETTDIPPRQRWGLMGLMVWTLLLASVVAAGSFLHCHYTYSDPLTPEGGRTIDPWGTDRRPHNDMINPMLTHAQGRQPPKSHNPWLHMGVGFGITTLLQLGALRWASWPLMPVGYLMSCGWYGEMIWFSIFLGWLAKALLVQFGGARGHQAARPVFVGLIFGEAIAAAAWAVVTLLVSSAGLEYRVVDLLPH